jgi:peptidylprolyl isomerase
MADRAPLRVLKSDSKSFAKLLAARRNRLDDFYRVPAGFLDVCNISVPVQATP